MLQFVRKTSLSFALGLGSPSQKVFLFHLAAAFSKPVDPLSGMSVNLVLVDQWLHDLKASLLDLQNSDPQNKLQQGVQQKTQSPLGSIEDLVLWSADFLKSKALQEGAQLSSLCFQEERGRSWSWDAVEPTALRRGFSYFLEAPALQEGLHLLKLHLEWAGAALDHVLEQEGSQILQMIPSSQFQDLQNFLQKTTRSLYVDQAQLVSVKIENLSEGYTVASDLRTP